MMRFILVTAAFLGISTSYAKKPSLQHRKPAQTAVQCPAHEARTTMLKTKANTEFPVSVITPCEAEKYFAEVASAPNIPYAYPEDGCYARAHAMSQILERENVITGKVFVEGNLRVETPNSPKGYVEWVYHVAPVVAVETDGAIVIAVIDPAIFNHTVTVEEWIGIQTRHQGASRDKVYQTNRFHYIPSEQDEDLNDYKIEDINDMELTLRNYMQIVQSRKAAAVPLNLPPPPQGWETHK